MPQNTTVRRYDTPEKRYHIACTRFTDLDERYAFTDALADHAAPLETRVLELEEELSRMRGAGKWISVSERLPDRIVQVIICIKGSPVVGELISTAYYGTFELDEDDGPMLDDYRRSTWRMIGRGSSTLDHYTITHWQPLPTPPQE